MATIIEFKVREETAGQFFQQFALSLNGRHYDPRETPNPFYLLKDRILLKKECGIEPGQPVTFTLLDNHQTLHKHLVNIYVYDCKEFDSIAVELVLKDFKVEVKGGRIDQVWRAQ